MSRGTLVFDLDGTLAETAPDIMAALNFFLLREGLAPLPISAARALVGSGAKALIKRGFEVAGAPLPPEKLEAIFADLLDYYLEHIAKESHYFPGAEAALDALAADGFTLAICTNKPELHAKKLMQALGKADRFAFLAGRETYPFCKPDPRHILQTIRDAGGEASRAIMIGDSFNDIEAARAARLPSIGVTFGYTLVPMDQLGPDRLITHFDDLRAAAHALLPQ